MKYRVSHKTVMDYESRVSLCYNLARLTPRTLPRQQVLSSTLQIDPLPTDHYVGTDAFGNRTDYFSIQQPHETLIVTAVSEVESLSVEGSLFDRTDSPPWEQVCDQLNGDRSPDLLEAFQFTLDSQMVTADKALHDYAAVSLIRGRSLGEAVNDLMERIFQEFKYDPEFSSLATPLKDVLAHRRGVCQDFAHLAIGCLRSHGLAARYVSGYIETVPPPGEERMVGADASHAWFSVFQPGKGWLDFDPTNNQLPSDRHITVAWGRDYTDVTPLKGVAYGGGEHQLKVSVDVEQVDRFSGV